LATARVTRSGGHSAPARFSTTGKTPTKEGRTPAHDLQELTLFTARPTSTTGPTSTQKPMHS
jgi:hypothetical protein